MPAPPPLSATRPARRSTARRRATGGPRWWLVVAAALAPAVVLRVALGFGLANAEQLIGAVLAAGALVLVVQRPVPWIAALIVVLPFQLILAALLYDVGVPGGTTRMAALWKELVVLGVAIAAWWRTREQPGRLDALDRVAVAFTVLGTLYLLLPELFVGDPGADVNLDTRFVAWRLVVVPSILLLACRRLRPTGAELGTIVRGATAGGVLLGVTGIVEFVASGWWNRLLVDTIGINWYRLEVLEVGFPRGIRFNDIRIFGEVAGREIVRVGGPVVSHLTFSYLLLIALAVALERLVRGRSSLPTLLATVTCSAALLFTQTRSTIVAAGILVLLALRPLPGRPAGIRARYGVLVAVVAVAALPLVFQAGLADRFTSGDAYSDTIHDLRVENAIDTITDRPWGLGLAMGSTASGRTVTGAVSVENQLLDTAVQLGVLGALIFVAQYVLLALRLHRSLRGAGPTAALLVSASLGLLVAFVLPLYYQQAFGLLEVSWVLFAIAGTALGAAEADAADLDDRRPDVDEPEVAALDGTWERAAP